MGEADRYIEYKDLRKKKLTLGNDSNAIMGLFILNTVFFLLLFTIQVIFSFYEESATSFNQSVLEWFTLPGSFYMFLERPWTIITFMFSEGSNGLWRVFSNILWLWSFGSILQRLTANNKIIPIYIYGGWIGAFLFFIYNSISQNGASNVLFLGGANASILALATAATSLSPNHRLLTHIRNGIPLWIFFIVFLCIDFIGIHGNLYALGVAHLGGIIAGWTIVLLLKKGIDICTWMNLFYYKIFHLFSPKNHKINSVKDKIFYTAGNRTPYEKKERVTQDRIDALLDKINLNGYESLTEEEKDFLKKASYEDNL